MKNKISKFFILLVFPVLCFVLTGFFAVTTFVDGYASAVSGNGGAIYVANNSVYQMGSGTKLSGSSATNGGGIYVSSGGRLTVRGSNTASITNCYAGENGGGIYNAGTATLSGITVSNNSGNLGANIYNSGTMTISSGTIGSGTLDSFLGSYTRIDADGNEDDNGEYVLFGSWPQTIKAQNVTINELDVDENGFYLGSDGNRYGKAESYPMCPEFSDGTEIEYNENLGRGVEYYFKVEPLKWRILKEENGQALIFCETIVDFMMYTNATFSEKANSYKVSGVRSFLNLDFYKNAFSNGERKLIALSETDNSVASTGKIENNYICQNTNDYVFSLSVAELSNTNYFATAQDRKKNCTDYVVCKGAIVNAPTDPYDYFTRSPASAAPQAVQAVDNYGELYDALINHDTLSHEDWLGVVPALYLNMSNSEEVDLSSYDSGIYNTGTLNINGGTIYGKVVSTGVVNVNANMQFNFIPFDLKDTGTMVIKGYSGNVATFTIQVSKDRDSGVIASFSGNTAVPDLKHFNFEGINSTSQEIRIVQNSSGVYELVLYSSNQELPRDFKSYISNPSSLTNLRFVGLAPVGYELSSELDNGIKIYVNENDGTDVAVVYEYGMMLAPENCSSLFSISTLKSISFDNLSFSQTTNASSLFKNCSALVSISGLESLTWLCNCSEMFYGCSTLPKIKLGGIFPTDASSMFYGCSNLYSINAGSIFTDYATSLSYMFYGCSNLTSIDTKRWTAKNATYLTGMFSGCTGLKELNLSNFATPEAIAMNGMFMNCSALKRLDLSAFDTSNVTAMNQLFLGSGLYEIEFGKNFKTSNVTNMLGMFSNCVNLKSLDLSGFDMSSVTNVTAMLSFGTNNKIAILKTPINCTKNITITSGETLKYNSETVSNVPANSTFSKIYVSASAVEFPSEWRSEITTSILSEVEKIQFVSGDSVNGSLIKTFSSGLKIFKSTSTLSFYYPYKIVIVPQDCSSLFEGLENLKEIKFNNNFIDVGQVRFMSSMFYNCKNLTSLDLSGFNTSSVLDMSYMFESCSSLTELNLSSFNTSSVTNMSHMFENCTSLTGLNLSSFDTFSVEKMGYMFYRCIYLISLDLSNFNMSNVTECSYMLYFSYNSYILKQLKTPYNNAFAIPIATGFSLYYNGSLVSSVPAGTTASLTYTTTKTSSFVEVENSDVCISKFEIKAHTNEDLFSEDKSKIVLAILEEKENGKLKNKDKLVV